MSDLVLRDDRDGIATLTLNRPEALNALSPAVFVALRTHIDRIAGQIDEVGCVILRGEGRAFSAGNDLKAIQSGETAPSPAFQAETITALAELPQPVIGSVRGYCYTGALELALACDLIVAAESAKFADTHGRWAFTPTWGMSQRLPRRIGQAKAKEMMFTGRPFSGAEAAAMGLANVVVPDDELEAKTNELAAAIVANSWHTLRGDKWLVHSGAGLSLAEGLRHERENSPGVGPDSQERVRGFGSGG